jgi:hypothetical protein
VTQRSFEMLFHSALRLLREVALANMYEFVRLFKPCRSAVK